MSKSLPPSTPDGASVYRKAAERVATGRDEYSCLAIRNAMGGEALFEATRELQVSYLETFEESGLGLQHDIYIAAREETGNICDEKWCRNFRILALCFMAEITERP